MPEWTMKVLNPADILGLEEVFIDVDEEEEGEKIRVGQEFTARISYNDDIIQSHCFRIVKITSPENRKGEILHLGFFPERIKLTLEMIRGIENMLVVLNEIGPDQIIQFCPRCHLKIIPENFLELICCPFCGKSYNMPL